MREIGNRILLELRPHQLRLCACVRVCVVACLPACVRACVPACVASCACAARGDEDCIPGIPQPHNCAGQPSAGISVVDAQRLSALYDLAARGSQPSAGIALGPRANCVY